MKRIVYTVFLAVIFLISSCAVLVQYGDADGEVHGDCQQEACNNMFETTHGADPKYSVMQFGDLNAHAQTNSDSRAANHPLDGKNKDPLGVTFGGERIWVVDRSDGMVYAYTGNGALDETAGFELAQNSMNPVGITYMNGAVLVVDRNADEVYAYTGNGALDETAGFELARGNEDPTGITHNGERILVVDSIDDEVYAYTGNGALDETAGFELAQNNGDPTGITHVSCRVMVVDHRDDAVYAYTGNGALDETAGFELAQNNGDPTGITYDGKRILVVDRKGDVIYAYGQDDITIDCDPPTVLATTFFEGDGRLSITFSETVDVSAINLAALFLSDAGMANQIPLAGSTVITSSDSDLVSIQLTEPLRQRAIVLTTPELDVGAGAVRDTSSNPIMAHSDSSMDVNPDNIPPAFTSVKFNKADGLFTITFSETVDVSTINLAALFLSDAGMANQIPLAGSTVITSSDSDLVSIQLTEPLRQRAIALTTPELDVGAGAVRDTSGTGARESADNPVMIIDNARIGIAADAKEISIASWNLLDFGGKFGGTEKIDDPTILTAMADVVKQHDIIFVQEIANQTSAARDSPKPFDGFNNLCGSLEPLGYSCQDTGVINDGEGYGVIYKDDIVDVDVERTDHVDTEPHIPTGSGTGEMRRPPMKAVLDLGNAKITAYNAHTKPDVTAKEISLMSDTVSMAHVGGTVIVLGDLNADGKRVLENGRLDGGTDYYRGGFAAHKDDFPADSWTQTVKDSDVTNFVKTQRAYDRIIISNALTHSYVDYDIIGSINNRQFNEIRAGEDGKELSDHRLVLINLKFGSIKPTGANGVLKSQFSDDSNDCKSPSAVHARGEGFVPEKNIRLYITEYEGGSFKDIEKDKLTDVTGGYESVTTGIDGSIQNTELWATPLPGSYNVIADVNVDGYFTYGIDEVDVMDGRGFVVQKCMPSSDMPATGTITGTVFADSNGNGARDADERGIETAISIPGMSTESDSAGMYTITDVIPGSYQITVTVPTGYDPVESSTVAVTAGQTTTADFALQPTQASSHVTLNIFAYNDYNGDGIRNGNDDPFSGLLLLAYVPSTQDLYILSTGPDGTESKDDLPVAEFYVIALPDAEYKMTTGKFELGGTTYYGVQHIDPVAGGVYLIENGLMAIP